jgi:hypothetical protein
VSQPGLLRKAKARIHRTVKKQGRLYPDPVVQRAVDLLADVWAAGRDLGVTEKHWDSAVGSLPTLCLIVAERAVEDLYSDDD